MGGESKSTGKILVDINIDGTNHFVGTMWHSIRKNRAFSSFQYSEEWQANPLAFTIDPVMTPLHSKEVFRSGKKALFGCFEDAAPTANSIPPMIRLRELLEASEKVEDNPEARKLLLTPGSSLGGARPKTTVLSPDMTLNIAKFESSKDEYNVIRWEAAKLETYSPEIRMYNV